MRLLRKRFLLPNDLINNDVNGSNKVPKDPKKTFPKPFTPPLPFSQRMATTKLDQQFGKFLEVLKKLHINIPLIDTLS